MRTLALCCFVCLLGIASLASASTPYLLGPGDEVTVTVLRHADFSGEFTVAPDGNVDIPAAGRVQTNGRTVDELNAQIRERLSTRLRKPEVTVTLRAARLNAYVIGQVKIPGQHELRAGQSVLDALGQAGGLTIPEDEVTARILREGREVAQVDLRAALAGDSAANVTLLRGDVLKIDSVRGVTVMLAGKVKKPGAYQIKDGDGIVEALTLAGGAADDAMLTRVTIVRANGVSESINASPAVRDGVETANVKLRAGDLIIVPEAAARIAVLGYVAQPGSYPLKDGQRVTLSDAVSMAGGADRKDAAVTAIAMLRTKPDGTQERLQYDLNKFLKHGDAAQNPEVRAGDVIFVPRNGKTDWNTVFQGLSSFGALFGPLS
jgi:protein involved in polysaccharide export with SLBB domain